MRIEQLEYHQPETLPEACQLLGSLDGTPRVIAGGTDVLADLKQGTLQANHLVSLARIEALRQVDKQPDGSLIIGPLVTPNALAENELVRDQVTALADASGAMAGNQIRNLATVGGNICSAVPSADLPPALLVVEARVRLVSDGAERKVPLKSFFTGPRKTVLQAGEVLAAIEVPPLAAPATTGSAYERFQLRQASALAVVGVAACVTIIDDVIERAIVAIGAAAPTPLVIDEVGELLAGKPAEQGTFEQAGEVAQKAIRPISDLRASERYRRDLAKVLTIRALVRATERARS